jgi:hypothetical protein
MDAADQSKLIRILKSCILSFAYMQVIFQIQLKELYVLY